MQFHLNINTGISKAPIEHQHTTLLIGSCFTEHIAKKLHDLKFNSFSNPFGIVFNPLSINQSLNRIIDKTYFTEKDVMEQDGGWLSLETHSSLSMPSQEALINKLNGLIEEWHTKLVTAKQLIITFGSAYVYEHSGSGLAVANCHKLPGKLFHKHLCNTNSLIADYALLLKKLEKFNPGLNLIFTISPVKHLRDGVIENNLSKAILIQTVHEIMKQHSSCLYFPAYELVNDDLRDYRFYEADMAHPNKLAIDYVWSKFAEQFFTADTKQLNAKLQELNLALHHRPLNPHSAAFATFKRTQAEKCKALQNAFPFLNFDKEASYFLNETN